MASSLRLVLVSCFLLSLFLCSTAQTCKSYTFISQKTFRSCNDLPVLDSFIHFSYDQDAGTLDLAYRHTKIQPTSWVAWAINPTGKGMIGAQALVAYTNSSTGAMRAYTSPIESYSTNLQEAPLSFEVPQISAEYANNEMIIFATLVLPNNMTVVNQLWQDGPIDGGRLGMHALGGDHLRSMGTLDLLSGQVIATKGGVNTHLLLAKKIHGGVNMVSWGILMPIGGMAARYMKMYGKLDPLWFYIHVVCQTAGFTIGFAGGVGTAVYMAIKSNGLRSNTHSIIGIILFSLGLLQVVGGYLRLHKDHKYRKYWNIFHRTSGYTVIVLSIYNIYKGLAMLQPGSAWKIAYTSIIASLGAFAVAMELVHWKRRWRGICCNRAAIEDAEQPPINV